MAASLSDLIDLGPAEDKIQIQVNTPLETLDFALKENFVVDGRSDVARCVDSRDADGLKGILVNVERRILYKLVANDGEPERALRLKAKQSCAVFAIDLQLCGINCNKVVTTVVFVHRGHFARGQRKVPYSNLGILVNDSAPDVAVDNTCPCTLRTAAPLLSSRGISSQEQQKE